MKEHSENIKTIELYLTHICNRNCIFCFAKDNICNDKELFIPLKEITEKLLKAKKNGYTIASLLGGEPTLHPNFNEIVRIAKRLDFKVHLFSNALKLADNDFFRLNYKYIDFVAVNIPHYKKEDFELLTGLKNSYETMIKALKNISNFKIPYYLIFLANSINYKSFEEYIEFFKQFGLKMVVIHFPMYISNAFKNSIKIKVRYKEAYPIIKKAIDKHKKNIHFFFMHVPLCILKNDYKMSLDLSYKEDTSLCLHPNRKLEKVKDVKFGNYLKFTRCKECILFSKCPGVNPSYLKIFDSSEFKPVRKITKNEEYKTQREVLEGMLKTKKE